MLARDIIGQAPRACEVIPQTRRELDISDHVAVNRAIQDIRPDAIINAAAYTNVDGAESEPDLAFAVNGNALGFIGNAAKALGVPVIHYSTDYVFDGSSREPYGEDEPTSPMGVYGASKLQGEQRLAESGAASLIIRTQWLFGIAGPSFPRTMWKRATSGEATRVVDDQTGRPTYTVDLARATWGGLGQPEAAWSNLWQPGAEIVHIANGGTATWHDVAKRVFEAAGRPELLEPCSSAEYPTPARRPAWSVLGTEKYEQIVGEPLPAWEHAIDRFLVELQDGA